MLNCRIFWIETKLFCPTKLIFKPTTSKIRELEPIILFQVINGHKVVINETEYKSDGENGGTFFRVRVVDIHPDESAETTEANAEVLPTSTTDSTRDIESVEASVENEIPKIQENEVGKENTPEKLIAAWINKYYRGCCLHVFFVQMGFCNWWWVGFITL